MSEDNVYTRIPPQPKEKKPGQLTQEQVKQFFDLGYVQVDNYFDIEKELEPVKKNIDEQVDILANKLFEAGKIKDKHEGAPHHERLTLIEKEFPGSTVLLHKINTSTDYFRKLWGSEKLLNMAEQLVGPNISGHPVWNLRPKTPQTQNHDVPWHQDSGYLEACADQTLIVTAWIPLLDSNEKNGCLEMIPNVHKQNKVGPHKGCWENTWYIYMTKEDTQDAFGVDVEKDAVLCRVPYGGMLLFNNLLPHRSLPNLSNEIRWSLDLRWQDSSLPTGFSVKPPILLRHNDKPDLVPDWDTFDNCDRHVVVEKSRQDWFDTAINPQMWMKRWPLVHENKHTAAWKREEEFKHRH
jgi:hypothetical protein